MLDLSARLFAWNLARNTGRTIIMVVTVFCALSSYVLLGTALMEMASSVTDALRSDWPFDLAVDGRLTPEQVDRVAMLQGVVGAEVVWSAKAFIGSSVEQILAIPDFRQTAFTLELSDGVLPSDESEIAVPETTADAWRLGVGDVISLVAERAGAIPQEYRITGILSGKTRVLATPVMTPGGIARVRSGENYPNQLLIQLDGKVGLDSFVKQLQPLVQGAEISLETESYTETQENRSLSDSLVIGLRVLILLITALSLGVLFYLSLRNGAYQTGVLLAMGVQRAWLLLPALWLTLVIFAVGLGLTALVLPSVATQVGLRSSRAVLLSGLYQDAGVYLLVGLLSTCVINWQFLSKPVPQLLKDTW